MCKVENSKQKQTTESQDHTGLEKLVGRVQGRVGAVAEDVESAVGKLSEAWFYPGSALGSETSSLSFKHHHTQSPTRAHTLLRKLQPDFGNPCPQALR